MQGPHRSSSFLEQCGDCSESSVDVCFRCNRPWCPAHASLDMDLCRGCDHLWLERKLAIESSWDASPIVEVVVTLAFSVLVFAIAMQSVALRVAIVPAILSPMAGLPLGNAVSRGANRLLRGPLTRSLKQQRSRFLGDRPEVLLTSPETATEGSE